MVVEMCDKGSYNFSDCGAMRPIFRPTLGGNAAGGGLRRKTSSKSTALLQEQNSISGGAD